MARCGLRSFGNACGLVLEVEAQRFAAIQPGRIGCLSVGEAYALAESLREFRGGERGAFGTFVAGIDFGLKERLKG